MKSSLAKYCLPLLAALTLNACRPDPLGPTGVQVDILTEDSRLFATSFILIWMNEQNQLFQVRVPEEGFIDEVHAPAVSVFIAQTPSQVGTRRILVRGYRDDQTIVSESAARLQTVRNVWSQLGLKMVPFGTLADQDADGFPDSVDNCPREHDPCGSGAPFEADAGAPPDAEADASPDLEPDLSPDSPKFDPTGFPDGSADQRPRTN
jgi:hypothetical protein